jgi:hypothetical protein
LAYGSLTPSQIGELVRGFGSPHEAALEAIEDKRYKRLFDEIGGVRVVEQDGRLYVVPSSPTSEARFWDLVYAWAEGRLRDAEPKGESGRPKTLITQAVLLDLFRAGLERARSTKKRRQPTYEVIADEHGLKRTWTTAIVKWAETHQGEAKQALATSKTPKRFSALIRD